MTPAAYDRRYLRVKALTPLNYAYGKEQRPGTLRDISLCGALVLSDARVEADRKVQLQIRLPGDDDTLSLRGRITRLLDPAGELGPGFGVDFAVVSLPNRERIDNYVRSTFRTFRQLQFELSKFDIDWTTVNELLTRTYLPRRSHSADILRNLVTVELEGFRLRKAATPPGSEGA